MPATISHPDVILALKELEEKIIAAIRWFESEADFQKANQNPDASHSALGMAATLRSKHTQLAAYRLSQIDSSSAMKAVLAAIEKAKLPLDSLVKEVDDLQRDIKIANQAIDLIARLIAIAISVGFLA